VKTELTDTVNYIAWIKSRKIEIARKLKTLGDQRCYSNAMFIKALKEHKDALDVIELLKQDLGGYASGKVSLAQMSDVSDKLSAYSHLFQEAALNEFMELGRAKFSAATLKGGKSEARNLKGTLGKKIVALLTQLQAHLRSSLKNLESAEIRASYDFASFIDHSEREIRTLDRQLVRKVKYQKKLTIDYEVARNTQKKAQKDFDDSVKALSKAIDDLKRKRAYYASETARRSSENTTLDEVISVFKSRVAGVSKFLRGRMESFRLKGKFAKHNTHMKRVAVHHARRVLRSSRKHAARRSARKAGKKTVSLKVRVAKKISARKVILRKHKKNAIRLLKKVAVRHAVARVKRNLARKAGKKVSKRSARKVARRAHKKAHRAARRASRSVKKVASKSRRVARRAAKRAARKSARIIRRANRLAGKPKGPSRKARAATRKIVRVAKRARKAHKRALRRVAFKKARAAKKAKKATKKVGRAAKKSAKRAAKRAARRAAKKAGKKGSKRH
jgi:hypothetical protein